ncbi:hypothetical protein ACSDIF_02150 [Listeria monocytogenes]
MRSIGFRAFVKKEKKVYPVTDLCFSKHEDDQVCVGKRAYCVDCDSYVGKTDNLIAGEFAEEGEDKE